VEWQGVGDAVANANTLDAFCMEVDKTIGFHLVHGEAGAFTGTKLRGLAEAQGLTLSSTGRFNYLENANSQPSFVMFNRDDHLFSADMLRSSVVKGVTFQMDIPHVQQCAEAFNRMVQVARQMEFGLNAVLVDDNNKVLSDIKIEKIRQLLNVIQATMLVRGIVPGSDSALRLFS
jgi:FtsZ-interacting cell division protein ZipA